MQGRINSTSICGTKPSTAPTPEMIPSTIRPVNQSAHPIPSKKLCAAGMIHSPNSVSFVQSVKIAPTCCYRYIIYSIHDDCEDWKCKPSVCYDTVNLIRCCQLLYLLFASCKTLSDNRRNVYISLICDDTFCIVITCIFQSAMSAMILQHPVHVSSASLNLVITSQIV